MAERNREDRIPREVNKLCSCLQDEKDPKIGLRISKQNCEQLMETIIKPIVEPGNCDYGELFKMVNKLGSMESQLIGLISTVRHDRIGDAIIGVRDLNLAITHTIKRRLVNECGCKKQ